jgi:hypothetical protein
MYALPTALEGGFLLARARRDVDALLAAGRAASAYVAPLPVTAREEAGPWTVGRFGFCSTC